MKHISLSFIAVGLLLLCGCSEDNLKIIPDIDPNAIPLHFYASMESQQDSTMVTRATLSGTSTDDTRKVLWEPSDSIYVTNGKIGSKFSNVTEEDADVAEFSGELGFSTEYYAAFPYGFVNGFESSVFQLTLPTIQDYKADGFASESFPMVARCVDNVFEFKNLCGILVLNLTGTQSIDSIRFSGKSDTINTIKVSGPASVEMTYTDIPSLVIDSTANDFVILNCTNSEGKGVALDSSKPTPFHIVLPAETYAHFTIVIYSSDGKHMTINSEKPLTIKRSKRTTTSSITYLADKQVYEFVDLGLSVVWAIHNVGAKKPGEIGSLYSWGELQPKVSYNWDNYYYNSNGGRYENAVLSKYNTISTWGQIDSLITLELGDDIASIEWDGEWRMPSKEEIDELINNCSWSWQVENISYYQSARGYRIKGKGNGFTSNSIFIPTTHSNIDGGRYWSSSLRTDDPRQAWALSFSDISISSYKEIRFNGLAVRPVKSSQTWLDAISISIDKDSVSLNPKSSTKLTSTIKNGDNAYYYSSTWSSDNPSVASVDESGVVTAHTVGNAIITADCKGKTATCKITVTEPGYVDLGLSVLWATCNIGANSPNDQGYYYAWGEIENRKDFRAEKYKWYRIDNNNSKIIKYNYDSSVGYNGYTDGKYLLDINDDVAHEIWGSEWRLPTVDEIQELINNCTWTLSGRNYIIVSNVPGYADSPVILPKCGSYNDTEYQDIRAGYWSNSISKDDPFNANSLILSSSNIYGVTKSLRRNGFYVRPVRTSDSYLNKLSISLDKASESVQLDGSVILKATTKNGDRTVTHTIEWSSNDPSVATVDENGVVTGHKIGTAIISADCKGKTASCTVTVVEPECVELGLSVKWAVCNVGASKITDYGNTYAWGELEPKSSYGWANYSLSQGTESSMTKYCFDASSGYNGYTDSKTNLESSDDIAQVKWGGNWRMPSREEFNELLDNCNWIWTSIDGVYGYKISSKVTEYKDNFIFLPSESSIHRTGLYWSSTLGTTKANQAYRLQFNETSYCELYEYLRCLGQVIRPVIPSTSWLNTLSISLSNESITLHRNENTTLEAIVKKGSDEMIYPITWSSDNPAVATVDDSGLVTAISIGTANITATSQGKSTSCIITVKDYEYVDLGLSVNWATFNVGANKPEDYGNYYAWGETETKSSFTWSQYKYHTSGEKIGDKFDNVTFSKYSYNSMYGVVDNIMILESEDDVASVKWGGNWRLPSTEEQNELLNKCTWTWTSVNGVYGYRISSNITGYTDRYIFLPAAGYYSGYYNETTFTSAGAKGYYWSSSLGMGLPCYGLSLRFNSGTHDWSEEKRSNGFSVRPVCTSESWLNNVTITLNSKYQSIAIGKNYALTATIKHGADVLDRTIIWESNNPSIASVDENGLVTGLSIGTTTITATCLGKSATCIVTITEPVPECIDLGLSVNWATFNVGSMKQEEHGYYYAWGETEPKQEYSWSNYIWCDGSYTTLTKYCKDKSYGKNGYFDNKTILDDEDDVATAEWGNIWRMPTNEEFNELKENCNWTWTSINGVNGYLISGKKSGYTGNSIFLPVGGLKDGTQHGSINSAGFYWTKNISSSSANGLCISFSEDHYNVSQSSFQGRNCGLMVRPVCTSEDWIKDVSITINDINQSIEVGGAYTIIATVKHGNDIIVHSINWTSNNPSIASINEEGIVTALSIGSTTITATCFGKTATCEITVIPPTPVYVDLGLSVHWASFNIGAYKPEDFGDYYSWAEIETKDEYSWESYKWSLGYYPSFTKYNYDNSFGSVIDNNKEVDIDDDVAHIKWSSNWYMPTKAQFNELINNCTKTWTSQNGVYGYKFTGKNGNSIFLPASGHMNENGPLAVGSEGYYWASNISVYPNAGVQLHFRSGNQEISGANRYYGFNIRPVYLPDSYLDMLSISLNRESQSIIIEKTFTLSATVKYANTVIEKEVEWSSSNPSVATVNENGVVTGVAVGTTIITATCYGISKSCSITIVEPIPEYVDLGLSVNWATFNVGASEPQEYGKYYAWGEVGTKETYSWATYKWGSSTSLLKYNYYSEYGTVDNLMTIASEDDIAHILWGGNWRIPTTEEFEELRSSCTWTFTTLNGVHGIRITSRIPGYTDKSIFLPAAGTNNENGLSNIGSDGNYWSSSINTDFPTFASCYLFDNSSSVYKNINNRSDGNSIRAVYPSETWQNNFSISLNHENVTLQIDEEFTLVATPQNKNRVVTSFPIIWESSDTTILTVKNNGVVRGKKKGIATITASCHGKTASCMIKVNNYEYVDLGLSVKWATCNVGASSPEEYGDYFAWGVTETYYEEGYAQSENPNWKSGIINGYDWADYKYCKGSNIMNGNLKKYNNDGLYGTLDNKVILDSFDDVATVKMGGSWRIPSKSDMDELMDGEKCTWEWTSINGIYGYKIISKVSGFEGNNIFLPLAGYREGTMLRSLNISGGYWCNSIDESSSYMGNNLYIEPNNYISISHTARALGRTVRPVRP